MLPLLHHRMGNKIGNKMGNNMVSRSQVGRVTKTPPFKGVCYPTYDPGNKVITKSVI